MAAIKIPTGLVIKIIAALTAFRIKFSAIIAFEKAKAATEPNLNTVARMMCCRLYPLTAHIAAITNARKGKSNIPNPASAVRPIPKITDIRPTAPPSRIIPSASKPTHLVRCGNSLVHAITTVRPLVMLLSTSLMVGSSVVPKAMRSPSVTALNCSHGSTIAFAISRALSMPLMRPSFVMLALSPSVCFISRLIRPTASSLPNASFSCLLSATSSVSPNRPFSLFRISSIGSIRPWLSVKLIPSLSWALATPARNALYFVPASLPLMVDCSVPRMAICSDRPIPAAVAFAPTEVKALLISCPVVLNICTAAAVCPVSCSTHLAFPMASAWSEKMPYMVPM